MKILANLGKLKDGRQALVIEDAYKPNYAIVSGFNAENGTWDSARYFDGDLTHFSREITNINMVVGYDRIMQIANDCIDHDTEGTESVYVYEFLRNHVGMNTEEFRELDLDWLLDECCSDGDEDEE